MSHGLGLIIESFVALLLSLTIGYCMVLNGRLKRLRTNERAFRDVIGELVAATERAERSIGGLKLTVHECEQILGERLRMAERTAVALEKQIESGERLLGGIPGLTGVAAALWAPSEAPPPPDAKAMVAAAHAFAERARSRVFGRAA